MSTILRALRRLEKDKQDAAVRARQQGEVFAPAAPPVRRTWLAWVAAIVVGLALTTTLALYVLAPAWVQTGPGEPAAVAVAAAPPAASPPRISRLDPRPLVVSSPPPSPPAPAQAAPERTPIAAGPVPEPVPAPVSAPAPTAPAQRTLRSADPPPTAPAVPSQVATVARASEPAGREARSPAPAAAVVREAAPDFWVQRTVWHPRPERRVAHVVLTSDGAQVELREGDSLGPLRVEEITPSGVTFAHGDVTVSRRVGAR